MKLYKKNNPHMHLPQEKNVYCFDALGYYDEITFSIARCAKDLVKQTSLAQVGVEQTILVPATEGAFELGARFAGGISFILVDEREDTNLFLLAEKIESALKIEGIELKTYVTLGASAIAVIAFCIDASRYVASFTQYLNRLQSLSSCLTTQNSEIRYTFTIPLLKPDDFYNKLRGKAEEKIEGLYIAFSARIEQVDKINKFLDRIIKSIQPEVDTLCGKGMLTGTDDYYVYAKSVGVHTLVKLFCPGGMLSSLEHQGDWYGWLCNSTMTMVSFPICSQGNNEKSIVNLRGSSLSGALSVNWNVISTSATFENMSKSSGKTEILNLRYSTDVDTTIHRQLDTFMALRDSDITQWVHRQYFEIVNLFSELFLEEKSRLCGMHPNMRSYGVSADAYDFFRLLNQMLEALLNTSAYFTDSPGYRTIENNCLPRLLICYQRLINKFVYYWDHMCDSSDHRKHLFFLYTQDGNSVEAKMFFHKLPPDRRLIGISVPIRDAYYSATLIPLLLHEAGHYIGVRHREDNGASRLDIFIHLVVNRYFMRLIALAEDKDVSELVYWFTNPDEKSQQMCHLFLTMYEWYGDLYKNLYEMYNKVKQAKLTSLGSSDTNSEREKRQKWALEKNYFFEMSSILRNIFRYMLRKTPQDIMPPLEEHFHLCIRQYPAEEMTYRTYKNNSLNRIREAMFQVCIDLNGSNSTDFIQESENMLSEVIADVFMVRISKMDVTKYLCLVFERHVCEGRDVSTIVEDFEVTGEEIVRVLSICYALCHGKEGLSREICDPIHEKELLDAQLKCDLIDAFEDSRLRIMNDEGIHRATYLNFKRKVYDLYIKKYVKCSPHEWVRVLNDIVLPYQKVGEYALSLYIDTRYDSFGEDGRLAEYVTKIQQIYSKACDEGKGENTIEVYKLIFNG